MDYRSDTVTRSARRGARAAGDACSLLTDAQVSTTFGTPVDPGKPIASPATCQRFGKGKSATLTVNQTIAGKTAVQRFDTGKTSTLPGITVEPVSGVGDDAYYVSYSNTTREGLGSGSKKGNSAFEVRVYGFDVDKANLVGNGEMVRLVRRALYGAGVARERVSIETYFNHLAEPVDAEIDRLTIQIRDSG
jgi:hypothetical protein